VLKLCLLRHAETAYSRDDRFCGRVDTPLTAVGKEMAGWFTEAYASLPWQAIYASTRLRALETALPLAVRTGLPIERLAGLDEIHHGSWQGLTKTEVAQIDPLRYRRWCEDPTIGAPGGESVLEVRARALRAIESIRLRSHDGPVLVVSHKTTLRVLISTLMGVDLARYRDRIAQPICGLTVIDIGRDGPLLQMLGDVGHLPPGLRARALGTLGAEPADVEAQPAGLADDEPESGTVTGG